MQNCFEHIFESQFDSYVTAVKFFTLLILKKTDTT